MKKNPINTETSSTEGVINQDLFFCNDSFVVDYLTALLTSPPPLVIDSGDVHFMNMAPGTSWKQGGLSNSAVNSPIFFEQQISRVEAETLRSENENLKFRSELAKIDTQVLRGENDNLKDEIASLKAEIKRMKYSLEEIIIRNSDLESIVSEQKKQLAGMIAEQFESMVSEEQLEAEASSPEDESSADENTLPVPQETVFKNDPDITEQVLASTEGEEVISMETVPQMQRFSTVSLTKEEIGFMNLSSMPLDDPAAKWKHDFGERGSRRVESSATTNQRRITFETASYPSNPVSKVIKQKQVAKNIDTNEPGPVLKVSPVNHIQQERLYNDVPDSENEDSPNQQNSVAPPPVVEEPEPEGALRLADEADEIDLPATPPPKVVVKRNVKNYEDLQKESDSANETAAGHTLVL